MKRTFERARRPEQKEQRRLHLLETARGLLEGGTDLRDLSLNEIARQAGMAKANVYRYFESREALLLAVLWDEWSRWFASFTASWKRPRRRTPTLDELVASVARTLGRERLLCALTAALPTVLEQNLSEAAIRDFKHRNLAFFAELGGFLEGRCDALPASAYAELARDIAHAIMGLEPCAHPAPAVSRVLADRDLGFFRRDLSEDLERFALSLAANYARRARTSGRSGRAGR